MLSKIVFASIYSFFMYGIVCTILAFVIVSMLHS